MIGSDGALRQTFRIRPREDRKGVEIEGIGEKATRKGADDPADVVGARGRGGDGPRWSMVTILILTTRMSGAATHSVCEP